MCTFPDCHKPHMALGYCQGHYKQLKRGIELTTLNMSAYPPGTLCSAEECDRRVSARGYCTGHYQRHVKGLPLEGPMQENRPEKAKRIQHLRSIVDGIKLAHGCVDCGYNAHAVALDFDHLPGTKKTANVSGLVKVGSYIEVIMDEIAKCEIVCSNCHRVRTHTRRASIDIESDRV